MQRNSQETRKRILGALGQLLARSGFRDVGVNAVAREAGVDKVLIYRYFGGLPNLLQAYAEEGDFWPSASELLDAVGERSGRTDAQLAAALLIELGRAIRRRPITQEIMRWELLERNELTDALARYREEQALKLIHLFGKLRGVDAQAIASILAAGQTYLILRAKTADVYNGIVLSSDDDWSRIEGSIRQLTEAAFELRSHSSHSKTEKRPKHKKTIGVRRLRKAPA